MKTVLPIITASLLGLALAAPVQAGCGLTVTFDNDTGKSVTIQEVDTKPTLGNYATVYTNDFTIGPGKKITKAIESNSGCGNPHHIRAKYKIGASTKYATKGPIVTAVDKKITLSIKD